MNKILIVNKSYALGGIETALNNMVSTLKEIYDVDLLLYFPHGPLKDKTPDGINLIKSNPYIEALGMSFSECMKKGNLQQKGFRIFSTVWTKLFNNEVPINIALKHQKRLVGYDLAIAYHHEADKKVVTSGFTRFIDSCVDAKKKLAWIHYDPDKAKIDEKFNDQFYAKMDGIVCVSKSVKEKFIKYHPALKDKIQVCYNFLNYNSIYQQSEEQSCIQFKEENINLFSACRLTKEKAIPRGITAIAPILRKYPNVKWYIAGDGPENDEIQNKIKSEGLESNILLLGHVNNPYPYMRNADVLMSVSYHEAAPMVYLEAIAFDTFVLSTPISSAFEILPPNDSVITDENSEKGIYKALNRILNDQPKLLMRRNHQIVHKNNSKQLKQFKQIAEI